MPSNYDKTMAEIRLRREPPVVGATDARGYVVCSSCVDKGRATAPLSDVRYGATYSFDPCDKCGDHLNGGGPLTPV